MRYVLAVKSPIYGQQGAFLAYQFAKALIEKKHEIAQIFFFQDGVTNGNALVYPASDEVTSQRRGIVDTLTAENLENINLAEGFTIAGLGEFISATLKAERVITL